MKSSGESKEQWETNEEERKIVGETNEEERGGGIYKVMWMVTN